MNTRIELEEKHTIESAIQRREKLNAYGLSHDISNPSIRSNASLNGVAKSARMKADRAYAKYRLVSAWFGQCNRQSNAIQIDLARLELELAHTHWQTLEEIAQHLERLS